jgi:hypothetical protein
MPYGRQRNRRSIRITPHTRRQILEDVDLMVSSCPNLRKVNIVVHYKNAIMDDTHGQVRM